jgi:hypothetical protein
VSTIAGRVPRVTHAARQPTGASTTDSF